MSRYIDADALIADMQERYCKPCQERKEDYNGVRCRACWVDDAIDDADGFADNSIDIVRCKECKWRGEQTESGIPYYWCRLVGVGYEVPIEHFCSYGKREGE